VGRHGDWFECGWVVIEWLRMASLFDFVMVDLTVQVHWLEVGIPIIS
jgi:hypothetical protein